MTKIKYSNEEFLEDKFSTSREFLFCLSRGTPNGCKKKKPKRW